MKVNDSNRSRKTLATLAVICGVLQVALAPNIGIANGRANFAFVLAVIVALRYGGRISILTGFGAGLFFDLTSSGPIGLMALELTVMSFLLGSEERDKLSEDPGASIQLTIIASVVVAILYNLSMMLVGQSVSVIDALFLRALPTALLSCIGFAPFMYFLSRGSSGPRLHGRGGHSSMGGGHFSTKGL
ncbi:MAG: rod shape-determining protein MreD [Atopobiaceae bacterium]|jgi:rod shape-determining protein MreD|nr:rod shape-determining protein MreD [Atopobiaceae bacterium]MCI2173142.1 rod shape-determining protein MreD [Atopobiaceae bacterium]MCI2208235.1 rod shape-determining protein MreD [Atopobiaceae bacterium]